MKSLSTALKVLLAFTEAQQHQSVGGLAQRTGLTKGQVSKILSTFRAFGLLQQDPQTRLYSVGIQAFALGSRFVNYHPLCKEALPLIRRLVDRTGHSARLSVLSDKHVIYLLQVDGPLLSDTGWRAGMYLPPHATTAGKVALAFLDEAQREEMLAEMEMPQLTPNTITDKNELRRQLAEIAKTGYASSRGESTAGLGATSVPVFEAQNEVIAMLSLAYPEHVVDRREEPKLAAALHDAARTLSHRMGSGAYPFGGRTAESETPAPRAASGRRQRLPA